MQAPNVVIGQHWVNLLTMAGIACELHNRYLSGALGEIPADQCAPEIWLEDERDMALARRVIEATQAQSSSASAWACPHCGERLEPQFTQCWQCGASRESAANEG
jgi:hypothetical protein